MLQNIREHVKGWIAGVVIVLVGSTFVLWGVESYVQQNSGKAAVVAEVDGSKITENELSIAFRQIQKQQEAALKGASLTQEQNKYLKQIALQQLITNFALINSAKKAGFYVSMDQVKDMLMQIPAFQENGQFSNERFQTMLYNSGLSPSQFFEQVQDSAIMTQAQSGIEMSAFILPNELSELASLLKQTRSFDFFTLPISHFRAAVKVTDEQIKTFYTQNIDQFKTPERVQLNYIVLSPTDLEKNVSVTDEEIKQYFESNPANFSTQTRWQVKRYLIPLASDASNKEVADVTAKAQTLMKQIKNNENNAVKPTVSWVTQDQVSGPLAQLFSKLNEGDVSQPFRTAEGMNLVEIVKMEKGEKKSFDSVKADIRKSLLHQKIQQLLTSKSEQLSNLVYTNPNTLDVAAKALNLTVEKSPWLLRESNSGIFANPKIMEVAFSDEVLNQGNNSAPIELKDGGLMVLRVSEHDKSQAQKLSDVSGKIREELINQQAQREAGLVAYKIQTDLQNGLSPSEIAKKYSLALMSKNHVSRTDKSISPELLSKVFSLSMDNKNDRVASVLLSEKEYAVALLTNVNTPKALKLDDKEKVTFYRSLLIMNAKNEYQLYVKGIMSKAKIKVHS